MAITQLQPFNLDATANYTFANITASNANLGNAATASYFIGSGNNLSNIQGSNVTGQVGNSLVSGTVYTNAQPNITSVGSLTGLTVSNATGVVNFTTTANVTLGAVANLHIAGGTSSQYLQTDGAGNLSWSTVVSGSTSNISNGNSNVDIPTANGNINLSAVGNANILVITGTGANVTGTLNATGNANTGNLGTTNLVVTGTGSFGANVNMNTYWINNVGYPSANTDVATKAYVDTMISSGIAYHSPVNVATTTTLAVATSGTTSYNSPNGAANGIGAYISTTGTFLNIDSANVQTVGTRILVKDEANAAWNGIYTYANTTAIVRATDADQYGADSTEQLSINDFFFTTGGSVNKGTAFVVSAPAGTITFGTSNITFAVFSTSQVYDAGTGLTLTSTTFSISNTSVTGGSYGSGDSVATFTVNNQGQLTAASNTAITANAANLTGTVLNSAVVTSSLTSVGSLTGLTVSNATGVVNFTTTANVTLGAVANLHISGGAPTQYLQTDGAGNLSWVSVSTSSTLANGNSNVNIPTANGNINITAVGNTTAIFTGTGANIAGTLNVTGNANVGNMGTGGLITATGNITGGNIIGIIAAGSNTITTTGNANVGNLGTTQVLASANITTPQFISNIAIGTAPFVVTSTTQVANLNVATAGTAGLAVAVTGNAQSNITSVGSLTGLTVSNATGVVNFTTTSNVTLGNVANLHISGGSSGFVLQTDGTGVLSWVAQGGSGIASISNGNSNVNIPGVNGNVNITAVGNTTAIFTGTGVNVFGTLNTGSGIITGNGNGLSSLVGSNVTGQVGNSLVSGTVYTNAQPNITSVGSLSGLTVSNATGIVNFTNTSNVTLGAVGNLKITGGTSDYVLRTDGTGNLSWVAQSGGGGGGSSISNGNSNVNIATANGNITMTAVGNTIVTVTGTGADIAGNLSVTGSNVSLGSNSNVKITGGTNGFVLQTDGTGNLSWGAQGTSTTSIQQFTAAAAQTTFTVSGGYSVGSVIVFVNGIQMNDGDYIATNGTTIVLTEPRVAGDIVRVVSTIAAVNLVVSQLQNFSVAMSIALGI